MCYCPEIRTDQKQTTVLIVGTKKGAAIFKSDDRKNWSSEFALKGWHVTASARDDKGRYYAAIGSDMFGVAIMVSDDLKEWTQLEAAPRYRPPTRAMRSITASSARVISRANTRTAAVSSIRSGRCISRMASFTRAFPKRGFSSAGSRRIVARRGRLQQTSCRGEWVPGFGGLSAHTILCDANNPNRMWVGVSAAGFFRTDDGGKTWREKTKASIPISANACTRLTHDPKNAGVMFRQEHRGVYRSDDAGDTWRAPKAACPSPN